MARIPISFQFFVPYGNNLELVLNETTTNGGVGLPAGVTVEAFVDTGYTDADSTNATTVPEPGTWVLLALGMTFLWMRRRAGCRPAFGERMCSAGDGFALWAVPVRSRHD